MSGNNDKGGGRKGGFRRESILELSKWMDAKVRVKCLGGRELEGTLKGYDDLVNLVLDDCDEYLRGESVYTHTHLINDQLSLSLSLSLYVFVYVYCCCSLYSLSFSFSFQSTTTKSWIPHMLVSYRSRGLADRDGQDEETGTGCDSWHTSVVGIAS